MLLHPFLFVAQRGDRVKYVIYMLLLACSAFTYAETECGAAVDAADSMNVNQKECDYTDEGLNGVLHRAFKKGSEGAVLETGTKNSTDDKKLATDIAAAQVNKSPLRTAAVFSFSAEADQWSSVTLARAQLLPKAMERCNKGFSIRSENYRPLAMGRIALTLEFSCLE